MTTGATGVVVAEAGSRTSAADSSYVLSITGNNSAVTYSGTCWVRQADGTEQQIALSGNVPYSRDLRATGVRCEIVQGSAAGSLTVDMINKNSGSKSHTRTQGPGNRLHIEMR